MPPRSSALAQIALDGAGLARCEQPRQDRNLAQTRLKELKQSRPATDIVAKHASPMSVPGSACGAVSEAGVRKMARTRDFLDEWAEWYSLPESSARAGSRARALPSPGAPPFDFESLCSTAAAGLAALLEAPLAWRDRARQRRALLGMSNHMLDDMGISRAEALEEAAKPFWRT